MALKEILGPNTPENPFYFVLVVSLDFNFNFQRRKKQFSKEKKRKSRENKNTQNGRPHSAAFCFGFESSPFKPMPATEREREIAGSVKAEHASKDS